MARTSCRCNGAPSRGRGRSGAAPAPRAGYARRTRKPSRACPCDGKPPETRGTGWGVEEGEGRARSEGRRKREARPRAESTGRGRIRARRRSGSRAGPLGSEVDARARTLRLTIFSCFSERSTFTSRRVVLRTTASSSDSLNCERPSRRGRGRRADGTGQRGIRSRTPARRDDVDARSRQRARGVGPRERFEARTFFTATTSPVSLFLHLSTTPYAPSPTTPTTSYLFIARDALDSTSPQRANPPRRRLGRARDDGRPARRSPSDERPRRVPRPRSRRHERLRTRGVSRASPPARGAQQRWADLFTSK